MSNRILVIADPMGGSQRIIGRAADLAARLPAELAVVGFVYEHLGNLPVEMSEDEAARLKQAVIARHRAELEAEVAEATADSGVVSRVEVHWEKRIADWIIRHVAESPYELVVKTGNRSESLAYTPTDWQLLRGCPVPVLLLGEKRWKKSRHVLAAVDLGTRVRGKAALNFKVVEQASTLAKALGAELYIGYAVPFSRVLRDLDILDESQLKREGMRRMYRFLEGLTKRGIEVADSQVVTGAPEKALVNLAAKSGAGLVVLGTVGRKKLAGRVIGNTAEKLLRLLKADVLAIKP